MSEMKFCENCGAEIEDESFFCNNCGSKVNRIYKKSFVVSSKADQKIIDLKQQWIQESAENQPIVSRELLHRTRIQWGNIFEITFSLAILVFSLALIIPYSAQIVLPAGFMVIALVATYLVSQQSSLDNSIFIAVAIAILTLGTAIIVGSSVDLILPAGFMMVALSLTYAFYRSSSLPGEFFVALAIVILTFGFTLIIPYSSHIILPVGFMLVAVTCAVWAYRRYTHDLQHARPPLPPLPPRPPQSMKHQISISMKNNE